MCDWILSQLSGWWPRSCTSRLSQKPSTHHAVTAILCIRQSSGNYYMKLYKRLLNWRTLNSTFQIVRRFGFSIYIAFDVCLDIYYIYNKINVSAKVKTPYNLKWREWLLNYSYTLRWVIWPRRLWQGQIEIKEHCACNHGSIRTFSLLYLYTPLYWQTYQAEWDYIYILAVPKCLPSWFTCR
jgi:hypothetical protein